MSHVSKQLLRPILVVVVALALAVPAVGGTAAEGERNDGATVDTTVEIVSPTDETGIVVFILLSVDGPAEADDVTFWEQLILRVDGPAGAGSGASISPPQPICIPEAGTLCPRT